VGQEGKRRSSQDGREGKGGEAAVRGERVIASSTLWAAIKREEKRVTEGRGREDGKKDLGGQICAASSIGGALR